MPLNVNAGGSWGTASEVYAKVAGAWVTARELWGYMNGGWRSAWKNEIRYINTANRTAASIFELMGSPTQPGTYVFENQATISAGTGSYALRTGVFPAGSTLKIINKGYIRGKGGNGGASNGAAGGAGGTALYIDMNCTIDNGAGYIYGGGGGGGGHRRQISGGTNKHGAAGGGGAGSNGGAGGGPNYNGSELGDVMVNTVAASGSASAGGAGGVHKLGTSATYYTQLTGGAGGGLGVSGGTGSYSNATVTKSIVTLGAGGAAGAAVARNGKTVSITAGNDTTRIKGAIV